MLDSPFSYFVSRVFSSNSAVSLYKYHLFMCIIYHLSLAAKELSLVTDIVCSIAFNRPSITKLQTLSKIKPTT